MGLQIETIEHSSAIVVTLTGATDVGALEPLQDALRVAASEGLSADFANSQSPTRSSTPQRARRLDYQRSARAPFRPRFRPRHEDVRHHRLTARLKWIDNADVRQRFAVGVIRPPPPSALVYRTSSRRPITTRSAPTSLPNRSVTRTALTGGRCEKALLLPEAAYPFLYAEFGGTSCARRSAVTLSAARRPDTSAPWIDGVSRWSPQT